MLKYLTHLYMFNVIGMGYDGLNKSPPPPSMPTSVIERCHSLDQNPTPSNSSLKHEDSGISGLDERDSSR